MSKIILRLFLVFGFILLPFAFRKKPIKDWLIVYLLTALFSVIIDHVLVSKKLLSYPVRFLPKEFKFHVVFDTLLCPVVNVFYHQLTYKDKSIPLIVGKVFFFTIPQIVIEVLAGRYFKLVQWHKGWRWYHTFINMNVKYLSIRAVMGLIRFISKKQGTE